MPLPACPLCGARPDVERTELVVCSGCGATADADAWRKRVGLCGETQRGHRACTGCDRPQGHAGAHACCAYEPRF